MSNKGWRGESKRHALSRIGVPTTRQQLKRQNTPKSGLYTKQWLDEVIAYHEDIIFKLRNRIDWINKQANQYRLDAIKYQDGSYEFDALELESEQEGLFDDIHFNQDAIETAEKLYLKHNR